MLIMIRKMNYFISYLLLCDSSYLSTEILTFLRFGEVITIFARVEVKVNF